MANEQLQQLIDQSIALEHNVSDLYLLFSRNFTEDQDFWWRLCIEEKNHASLLRGGREVFEKVNLFPVEILASSIRILKQTNEFLTDALRLFANFPPERDEAFRLAYYLEESAGEVHYQEAMQKVADSEGLRIFQNLNRDDRDHARRIKVRMEKYGIALEPPALLGGM